jgi:hypothetical protein
MKIVKTGILRITAGSSRGFALIFVIIIAFIASLLTSLMMSRYLMQRRSARTVVKKIQDFYTAEAGIKMAVYYLTRDDKKGVDWRTGSFLADKPEKERVFWNKNDEAEISVIDDGGFIRIKSRAKNKVIETLVAGLLPEDMKVNLCLVGGKALILAPGGKIEGKARLNLEPQFRGGAINAILETNPSLQLPPVQSKPFKEAIGFFGYLLSSPKAFETELFSPQVFSPHRPFPKQKLFVNDAVLIENNDPNTWWSAGRNITIAATAEVQVSGAAGLNGLTICAIGPVKILDRVKILNGRIFSQSRIELREEASFSGILIAPEITVAEKATITDPSIIYCGPPFTSGKIEIIGENSVSASVIALSSAKGSSFIIGPKAKLTGFIYSLIPINHQGEIAGSVYCTGFTDPSITSDTVNTNILSGVIKPPEDTVRLLLPVVFPNIKEFRVINWQEN